MSGVPYTPGASEQEMNDARNRLTAMEAKGAGYDALDIAARLLALEAAGATFVTNAVKTISSLHSDFPPAAGNLGKYARVSDLYGSLDEVLRCRWDGVAYKWIPQREQFNGATSTATGSISIQPLITPPTLRMTATLTGNVNIAAITTYAYIGQRQRIITPSTVPALLNINLTGLVGGSLPLLAGSFRDIEYGSTGWFAA